jgi:hypothetical protein
MADPNIGTIGGKAVEIAGTFDTYDLLIERLRERAAAIDLSYRVIEEIAGIGEGNLGKYLGSVRSKHLNAESLVRIASALGVRGVFFVDPALVAQMTPLYEKRDAAKAHARRRAAALGPVTLRRVVPAAAAEMGRRGAAARNRRLAPETRRKLARAAALARWGYVTLDADGRPTRRTHPT